MRSFATIWSSIHQWHHRRASRADRPVAQCDDCEQHHLWTLDCLFVRWAGAGNKILANNAVYCPDATAVNGSGLTGSGLPGATITIRSNYVEGSVSGATVDGSRFVAGGSSALGVHQSRAARLLASCWFDPDRQGRRWLRAGARLQREGSREPLRRRRVRDGRARHEPGLESRPRVQADQPG